MKLFDVVIVGAGAAGLFCAGVAAQQGLQVLVLDHSDKVAEKIRISGGGRSNFTNRELDVRAPHKHFLGNNPQFCRSALSRFTPQDFVALMHKHHIPFHEKHKGQLFCDRSAEDLIQMLLAECHGSANGGSVTRWQPCSLKGLRYTDAAPEAQRYEVDTSQGTVRLVEPRPGLVPLTFDAEAWAPYAQLSGLSLPVRLETGAKKTLQGFDEDLLFTHRGLSGPGVLQISSYWQAGTDIRINLAPEVDLHAQLMQAKQLSKKLIANELNAWVPARLADTWTRQDKAWQRPVIEASDKALAQLAQGLSAWSLVPTGTEGYKKAEVTVGGVDTHDLSQQTMESKQPGLYFIGEVVDITGWLGGYNFQWAWASAHACALALGARSKSL
jgi:predicted flavoprotein YhiN